MKKPTILIALIISTLPNLALAAVEPFLGRIPGNVSSYYIVPEGKVLILQQVVPPFGDNEVRFQILKSTGGGSSFFYFRYRSSLNDFTIVLDPPIRLAAGWGIRSYDSANSLDAMGLLIDARDLYAAVPAKVIGVESDGEMLAANLKLASPRPVVVKTETSTDLENWTRDEQAKTERLNEPDELKVTATIGGAAPFFMRMVAYARCR